MFFIIILFQFHNMNVSNLEHLNIFQLLHSSLQHLGIENSRWLKYNSVLKKCFSSWLYNDLRVDISVNKLCYFCTYKVPRDQEHTMEGMISLHLM